MGSKAKVKILKALSSGKEFQLSEIKAVTRLSLSTVHEALKELVDLRILIVRSVGKTKLYRINSGNYFSKIVIKAVKQERRFYDIVLKEYIDRLGRKGITNATVFGSYARGKEFPKDIDILVVTNNQLKEKIVQIEGALLEKYDLYISTTIIDEKRLREKFKDNDRFILNVIAEGKKIYGKDLELIANG